MKLSELPVDSVVCFREAVADLGGYAEKGIKARVSSVEQRDGETLAVLFEYAPFREENQRHETAAFGVSGLETATEAGVVPVEEVLFFSVDQKSEELMEVVCLPSRPGPRPA